MNRESQAERIGRIIGDGLGDPADAARTGIAEQAVFEAMARLSDNRRRSFRPYLAAAAALLVLTAGAVIAFQLSLTRSMAYRVGEVSTESVTSDWVRNDNLSALPIVFENGSRFVLDRKSIAKVVEADDDRVRVDLNRGALLASVNGNGHTEWRVEAGPYTVRVLGTVFAVAWDADDEQLTVSVTSGHVAVSGADVGQVGVVLEPGQRLVSGDEGVRIERPSVGERTKVAESPDVAAEAVIRPVDRPSESATAVLSGARPTSVRRPPTDRGNAARGELSALQARIEAQNWPAAVALLDADGTDETVRSGGLDVLWHLADAARRAGKQTLSERLFTAIRRRFPNSDRAATAAFLLGKSSLDSRRDLAAAERWFNTYLLEAPGGALREETLGRLIEVYSTLGRRDAATQTATRYLRQYPNGSFSENAKRHVSESAERSDASGAGGP